MENPKSFVEWFFSHSTLTGFFTAGSSFVSIVGVFVSDDPHPVLFASAIIFTVLSIIFIVVALRNKRQSKQKRSRRFSSSEYEYALPEASKSLLELCKNLLQLVTENAEIIERPNSLEDVSNLCQDVEKGVLRIYFFGHQKAGKSTLINALLDSQLSPTSSGKMTTCLIRIRQGNKPKGTIMWENRAKQDIKINVKSLKRKMAEWSKFPDRQPVEVALEINNNILGIPKLELVDTPGVGSIWNEKYGKNLLDETVNKKIKTAAVAILVYKYGQAEMQPHGSLLQELKIHNIKVLGVCNITPDLESEFQDDKNDILDTIGEAEKQLRYYASNVESHRVVIKEKENLIKLARQIDGETISEFRSSLVATLDSRESFVRLQTIREGLSITDELLIGAEKIFKQYQPIFNTIKVRKTEVEDAINSVKNTISKTYDSNKGVTQAATTGGLSGATIGALTGYLMGIASGGLIIPVGIIGGIGGSLINAEIRRRSELDKFEKNLATVYEKLKQAIKNANVNGTSMFSEEIIKEVLKLSSSLSKSQTRLESIMNKVEKDMNDNLQKIEGYELYRRSEVIVKQLSDLRNQFNIHLSSFHE